MSNVYGCVLSNGYASMPRLARLRGTVIFYYVPSQGTVECGGKKNWNTGSMGWQLIPKIPIPFHPKLNKTSSISISHNHTDGICHVQAKQLVMSHPF